MTTRTWHKGPPPHVGWWNASTARLDESWRWWDGSRWSVSFSPNKGRAAAGRAVKCPTGTPSVRIEWNDYWPDGARVPRIDPAIGHLQIGNTMWIINWMGYVESYPADLGQTPKRNPLGDSAAWKRWAEQRNAKPYEHVGRDAVNKVFNAIHGRTRMVDGQELTRLADKAHDLAVALRQLANSAC